MGRIVLTMVSVAAVARLATATAGWAGPMASHFDASGRPNGFMSPLAFVAIQAGVLGVLVASSWALPVMLRRLPATVINLPNKEHWLAPERRDATARAVGDWFAWMGVATALIAALAAELALRANQHAEIRLASGVLWAGLGAYVAFAIGWLVAFWRRFQVPRGVSTAPSR